MRKVWDQAGNLLFPASLYISFLYDLIVHL